LVHDLKPRLRPNPWQWLRYAFGASLPTELREWVLHDTTGRTWIARHLARMTTQMSPLVVAILLLVPGAFWIRLLAVLGGVIMGTIFSVGYAVETTEHRLMKAGYPVGTGEAVRERRQTGERSRATALRREKMAARAERRISG
jgi:hypothetical protein